MNTYTLQDLQVIFDCKHYLSQDRFVHYFTTRFGYEQRAAQSAFKLFYDFPRKIYDENSHAELDAILPKAIALVYEIKNQPQIPFAYRYENDKKNLKKLIWKEHDLMQEFVIDMNNTNDIITYAEILKRKIEIIVLLSFCTEIDIPNTNPTAQMLVFEGDFFDTNDKYWGDKSNVYLAEPKGTLKRLIYIKGKGYLNKGEPNIDEDENYSDYVLRLVECKKLGNVITDLHILNDNQPEK